MQFPLRCVSGTQIDHCLVDGYSYQIVEILDRGDDEGSSFLRGQIDRRAVSRCLAQIPFRSVAVHESHVGIDGVLLYGGIDSVFIG